MSTVLEQIEQQIAKLSSKAVRKNTGVIRTVADGVAKIDGLSVSLTYAVSSAPVPAPLPLLGLACGFAASRRLRRRVLQNQGQHRAP